MKRFTRKLAAASFVALLSVSAVGVTAAPANAARASTGNGWCC